jgi:hypothetical protein
VNPTPVSCVEALELVIVKVRVTGVSRRTMPPPVSLIEGGNVDWAKTGLIVLSQKVAVESY